MSSRPAPCGGREWRTAKRCTPPCRTQRWRTPVPQHHPPAARLAGPGAPRPGADGYLKNLTNDLLTNPIPGVAKPPGRENASPGHRSGHADPSTSATAPAGHCRPPRHHPPGHRPRRYDSAPAAGYRGGTGRWRDPVTIVHGVTETLADRAQPVGRRRCVGRSAHGTWRGLRQMRPH